MSPKGRGAALLQGTWREQAGLGLGVSSRGQGKSLGTLAPLKLSALSVPGGQ